MELTDIPDDAYDGTESVPDLEGLASPTDLLRDGPIRERLFDVVLGVRTPEKVSTIAERAECDTETAREYLEWFAKMGMVDRQDGRPVRYARNDRYFRWRRIDRIRATYAEQEIVTALADTLDAIDDYRERFDAAHPDAVSLVEATRTEDYSVEAAWEDLSEWASLEQRASLLDAARREDPGAEQQPDRVDV